MTAFLLLWVALVQTAGRPSTSDAPSATAVIRGRVTDKDSGAPIVRALVRLGRRDVQEQRAARTDSDGRYEFAGLPAGEYSGFVQSGEHRATHLMAPLAAGSRGRIVLKEGEIRDGVNVTLARSLAMTVRVVDEWGEPLSGVSLRVRSADTSSEYGQWTRTTDDRGLLRVYELATGRYFVCAEPSSRFSIDRADSPGRERFLRTCYPSAASETEAQVVRLDKSDLDGVVIQIRLGRAFTISGTVVGANGAVAQNARVSFETFEVNGSSGRSVTVDAGGRFSVSNVQPGDYAIQASIGGPDQPEQRQDLEVAFLPIVVESSDINDVVVAMSKTVDVAGRFVAEDGNMPLPPPGSAGFLVSTRLAGDQLRGQGSSRRATADTDRTFRLTRMFGKQMLDVANIPRGWYVKSIRYAGKEIIDVATEFKAGTDPSALEIVLSNRGATIAGRVMDERGEPVRGARIVIVPTDPARWGMFRDYVPSSPTGTFRLGPQRAGDYTVVAVGPSGAMPQPVDRARFAQLIQAGERITVGENEERALDLTVAKLDAVR
jgi:hypothetical protein